MNLWDRAKEMALKHLVERLAGIPGIPAKAGQFLAMRNGLEYRLPARAQLSEAEVRAILREQSPAFADALERLSPEAKVASLSQVHEGWLRDGRRVAVKVQLPGLRESLREQLWGSLGALKKYGPSGAQALDLQELGAYLEASLVAELDYEHEAKQQQEFAAQYKDEKWLRIPEVLLPLSTGTVLVQEFVETVPRRSLLEAPLGERTRVSGLLLDLALTGIFKTGWVQADLHPGNWGVHPSTGQLVLFDFGAVLRIDPEKRRALRRLVALGGKTDSTELEAFSVFADLGFDPILLGQLQGRLRSLASVIGSPFARQGAWSASDWSFSERMAEILEKDKWAFRGAGPPWFFELMRACAGLVENLRQLHAPVELRAPPVDPDTAAASCLKVSVTEGSSEVVYLEFPARAAGALEDLMSDEVQRKVEALGYSIEAMSRAASSSGFMAQELCNANLGSRNYRIWLE